jgi:hypothetical protein
MAYQLVTANALVNANSFGAKRSAQTKTAAIGLSADRGGFGLQEEGWISSAG